MNGAYICLETPDKSIVGVYCCRNGDIENAGAILLDFYNDRAQSERLISSGDLVRLATDLQRCKRYDDNGTFRNVCLQDLIVDPWVETIYLYTLSGEWVYLRRDGQLYGVKSDLTRIYQEAGIVRPFGFFGYLNMETVYRLRAIEDCKEVAYEDDIIFLPRREGHSS